MNDQQYGLAACAHRELAVGWALHALEPAEESMVAAHLPGCQICASIAAQTEEIGAMLGLCVPEMIPSIQLERRVLGVTGSSWAAPIASLAPSTQPARHITEPSEVDFQGWLSVTWADVVGHAGVEQALGAVGNS